MFILTGLILHLEMGIVWPVYPYSVLLLTLYKKIKQSKNTNTFQILLVFAVEIVSETESR